MLIQVFSIPSALFLSLVCLLVRYRINHYLSLLFCACGVICSVVNDVILKEESDESKFTLNALWGDLMVLGGAFLYAL